MNANVIPLNSTSVVQAIACKTGDPPVAVVNFTYTFTLNAPTIPAVGNNGAPGTYDDNLPAFFFTADGTNGANGTDANKGAPNVWECYTTDNTTPGCGPIVANAGTCMTPADQIVIPGSAITMAGNPLATVFAAPAITKGTTVGDYRALRQAQRVDRLHGGVRPAARPARPLGQVVSALPTVRAAQAHR